MNLNHIGNIGLNCLHFKNEKLQITQRDIAE